MLVCFIYSRSTLCCLSHGCGRRRETLVCRAMERTARVRKTQTAALVLAISWTHRIGALIEYDIKLTYRCSFIHAPMHTHTSFWQNIQALKYTRCKHSIKYIHTSAQSICTENTHNPPYTHTHIHTTLIPLLLISNFQPGDTIPRLHNAITGCLHS